VVDTYRFGKYHEEEVVACIDEHFRQFSNDEEKASLPFKDLMLNVESGQYGGQIKDA